MDKTRAAFCFFLAKQSMQATRSCRVSADQLTPQHIAKLKALVQACGGSFAPIDFIQRLEVGPSDGVPTQQQPMCVCP